VQRLNKEPFGFFEFVPSERLDLDLVDRMIATALDEVESVDVVLLPESAIDESEVDDLESVLDRRGVAMLMTGVREYPPQSGQFPTNAVHVGVNPRLEKGGSLPGSTGEQWFHVRQNKHHRWALDERQILQYHLGGALHPHIRWWEAMAVPRRIVHFVEHGDGIAIVSLVCEDLAQIDEVAEVIRSVGPTVVFAPLLDGPQLDSRWAARYASALADDPGSAVLTLTSFGMVQRSRPHKRDSSPVVGLWKDPVRGLREIALEPGAQGVLLTVCGDRTTRRSTDGRYPIDNATEYFDVALHQVRANGTGTRSLNLKPETPAARVLELDELTVLTGWAQALAEAVAYAPECVQSLVENACARAPWRTEFGIPEPSPLLCEALRLVARAVQAAASSGDGLTLDELYRWCPEDCLGKDGLQNMVRRVLRSTLEPLRARQTPRPDTSSRSTEQHVGAVRCSLKHNTAKRKIGPREVGSARSSF